MKGVRNVKFKKTICYILSFMMIATAMSPAFTSFAADEKTDAKTDEKTTDEKKSEDEEEPAFELSRDYLKQVYYNEDHKLSTMTKYFENSDYEIWGLEETGEVGIKVKATGQVLLTNPYDVSTSKSSDAIKANLLSQIMLTYSDSAGTLVDFNSYTDAASNGQIKMSITRTGLRVEYTLGKEQSKYLVPREIERTSFEENIISHFDTSSGEYKKLSAYYALEDPFDETLSSSVLTSMKVKWPITEKYAIYVLDPGISNRELELLASYIEGNTEYSFDKMAEDYELINYVDTSAAPALFRFAIEYTLDDDGIQVRMPATSIKYDSSNYKLKSVKFLPYFGAGSNENTGLTMVPDGSGTITRFEDIGQKAFTLTGKLYGKDFSFHSIAGYTQETMRLPAFGVIESAPYTEVPADVLAEEEAEKLAAESGEETADDAKSDETAKSDDTAKTDETAKSDDTAKTDEKSEETAQKSDAESTDTTEAKTDETADTAEAAEATEAADVTDETQTAEETEIAETAETAETGEENADIRTKGYVAYLVEGDAMTEISAEHGGTTNRYSTVYSTFYPKPSDTYSLTGISSSGDASWTVTSERRYTGNYTMRVFPISGDGIDYTDMAVQIRNYLEKKGILSRLKSDEEPTDDVPLYIENFGTIKTPQKIAGFPVNLQTPLTTFDQTKEIIDELGKEGVKNIDVKLTGWYNGGLQHTAPAKLSVPGALGGMSGLRELAEYCKENNIGIYPNIEFTYVNTFRAFDGFRLKRDAVKTIDKRSATHRIYNALYQGFEADGNAIISPSSMSDFYDKISKKYTSIGAGGISVGTLGSDLNSDHNEDYTLNRDDSETLVGNFLEKLKEENGKVMVDAGNAYSLPYADHILNVPLDSSLNINTSMSIPFMGMVLHGYTEFAGSAINLDGDYDYSVLKAMENGANLYFIVSKDNTSELKAFPEFSKYYAIRYDNWKQDMIDTYKSFNDAMKKVKYSLICEHEYLGTRIVRVAYDNGTEFILNYNTHDVELDDGTTVEALSFIVR